MERVKRIAGMVALITLISFCVSVVVFSLMRKDALEKMLTLQEMMAIQSLSADSAAIRNLTRARFQEAEETLYASLGVQMGFLKQIYDKRGRLPDQTVTSLILTVSKYQKASELSHDKKFEHVFSKDVMDFMSRVEKAEHEGAKAN